VAGWITGWKEIGKHCGLSEKTLFKYYKKFAMPIFRSPTGKPVALSEELAAWLKRQGWKDNGNGKKR